MLDELKEFGLTENEIKIYISLLGSNSLSPSEISMKTGFSRSYIYDALERLLEKEMVSFVFKNNKKHYIASDPKVLEEISKQKLGRIQKIMPELIKLKKISKEEIKVEIHKGTYIYKTLLKDITLTLKRGEEVLIFGIDDEVLGELDKFYQTHLEQYFLKLRKKGIKERVIVKKDSKVLKGAKTTSYRFLPSSVVGNTAFEVYGNKVAIFLWGLPNYLIFIDNKEVAKSYKNQFELLWGVAKR